jgi:putative endonuclease
MTKTAAGRAGLGQRGEILTAQALEQNGFSIVERNWRCPYGEVDLVARLGQDLYFIEVRTRRTLGLPMPEHSLTPRKLARMETVARAFLGTQTTGIVESWHLSFAAVAMDHTGRLHRITFYPDLAGQPEELLQKPHPPIAA